MLFIKKYSFGLSATLYADVLDTKQTKGTWNIILLYPFNRAKEGLSKRRVQRAGHIVSYPIFEQRQHNRKMVRATNPWPIGPKY